jgi:hypothetical protein
MAVGNELFCYLVALAGKERRSVLEPAGGKDVFLDPVENNLPVIAAFPVRFSAATPGSIGVPRLEIGYGPNPPFEKPRKGPIRVVGDKSPLHSPNHPAEIRAAEPRKQKHDQRDAEDLLLGYLGSHIGTRLCCHGARSFCRRAISLAGQVEGEGSDLERHLLGFGHRAYGLGLEHPQLIIPRVDLDASAERQRSNDVGRWLRIG